MTTAEGVPVLILAYCGHRRWVTAPEPMNAEQRAVEKLKPCPECNEQVRMSAIPDLDLEPPTKIRPLLVEITTTYLVWVEDDDDRGAVALADRENGDGDYELHKSGQPINGDYVVRAPDDLDRWAVQEAETVHGPWQVCPYPGCGRVEHPEYGGDPTCWKHCVTGCQDSRLPERVFS